ncbi:MAG: hypothetical protein HKO82_03165 [Acidimicrobiia bacterium]|nr:hypothetical protein [Acidimicrobiia bacterium]NNL12671.1 hypothetical protein [Acidimicrobiia bacterium]
MKIESVAETERWFLRRGVPHLIADYNAAEDVFTRVLPLLTAIFLFSMVGALNDDFSLGENVGVAVGGFALLIAIWAGVNWMRGRRPLLARPDRVGNLELTVFVFGPALVPIVFGGQFSTAGITVLTNLLVLGVVYLGASYGVLAILSWALRRLFSDFGGALRIGMRALPLLLLFNAFLFINAEVWQVTSRIDLMLLLAALGLFILLGVVFLLSRLSGEISELATFHSIDEVDRLCEGTPMANRSSGADVPDYPLSRRQRGNVGLVLVFSQGVLVLAVSVFIGLFFIVFGLLIMNVDTLVQWTEQPLNELYSVSFRGDRIVLTEELLRAAGFLAAFSGLYFTVNAATEPTYRREFFDGLLAEVRQSMAVREAYLTALED